MAALPGWIGDNASTRWLEAADKANNAAATPSRRNACRNEKRERSEVAIMRCPLVEVSDSQRLRARTGRFQNRSFAFKSQRVIFSDLFAVRYSHRLLATRS
jgi:hypothetical protein